MPMNSLKKLLCSLSRDFVVLVAAVAAARLLIQDVRVYRNVVENGWVETAQMTLCGLAGLMAAVAAFRGGRGFGRMPLLLALLFFAMFFRELDAVFDKLLFHGAWQCFSIPLGVAFLWQVIRHFRDVCDDANALLATPTGRHLEIGFLTLLVFSRVLGMKALWKHIFDIPLWTDAVAPLYDAAGHLPSEIDILRHVKNAVEEGVELYGYMLLFFAVMEMLVGRSPRVPAGAGNAANEG